MTRGKKTTVRFDHRINIRISSEDWHRLILHAQKENMIPSSWARKVLLDKLNHEGEENE
jgi:predicted HicB family RNase H-like nuclease